ncbi:MAG: hypothetical protein PHF37_06520 [Phycisphaerae bacterium]|nr:hypothetical protein [Phycisphaerae bacterium]
MYPAFDILSGLFYDTDNEGGGADEGAMDTPPAEEQGAEQGAERSKEPEFLKNYPQPDELDNFEKVKESYAKLREEAKEIAKFKKMFGDSQNELGKFRKTAEKHQTLLSGLKDSPEKTIAALAKEYGVGIKLAAEKAEAEETAKDLEGLIDEINRGAGDPKKLAGQLKASIAALVKAETVESSKTALTLVDKMAEQQLASTYKDWDNLADDREAIKLKVITGKISNHELYHLAAKVQHFPKALQEAEKIGYEKAVKELSEKIRKQMGPGAARYMPEKGDKKEPNIDNVLDYIAKSS